MQFLIPIHAIGLGNAWIGTLLLAVLGFVVVRLHPAGERLADASWFTEEELRWAKIATLFNLNTMLYSIFVPLRPESPLFLVGLAMFCIGLLGAIWAYTSFLNTAADKAVLSGLYKISRNPIYVFTWLALFGLCLASMSWILFLLLLLWILPMHKLVVAEERHCQRQFKDSFEDYLRKVPRYL